MIMYTNQSGLIFLLFSYRVSVDTLVCLKSVLKNVDDIKTVSVTGVFDVTSQPCRYITFINTLVYLSSI